MSKILRKFYYLMLMIMGSTSSLHVMAQIRPDQIGGFLKFDTSNIELQEYNTENTNETYVLRDFYSFEPKFSNHTALILTKWGQSSWQLFKTVNITDQNIILPVGFYRVVVNGFAQDIDVTFNETKTITLSDFTVIGDHPLIHSFSLPISRANIAYTKSAWLIPVNQKVVYIHHPNMETFNFVVYGYGGDNSTNKVANYEHFYEQVNTLGSISRRASEFVTQIEFRAPTIKKFPDWPFKGEKFSVKSNSFSYDSNTIVHDHYNRYPETIAAKSPSRFLDVLVNDCTDFHLNNTVVGKCHRAETHPENKIFRIRRLEIEGPNNGFVKVTNLSKNSSFQMNANYGFNHFEYHSDFKIEFFIKNANQVIAVGETTIERSDNRYQLVQFPTTSENHQVNIKWILPQESESFSFFTKAKDLSVNGDISKYFAKEQFAALYDLSKINPFLSTPVKMFNHDSEIELFPGLYSIYLGGTYFNFKIEEFNGKSITIKSIGVAKTSNTIPEAFYKIRVIESDGTERPIFVDDTKIPYGKYLFVLPGRYRVNMYSRGEHSPCVSLYRDIDHNGVETDRLSGQCE